MSTLRSPEWLLALALAAWIQPAGAVQDSAAAQRERIARARLAVEREAKAAQKACAQQFAVTDCVNRAKAERRERMQPLDREQAVLDDEARKRRAAERLAQIQQRQAASTEQRPEVSVRTRKPVATEVPTAASTPTRSLQSAVAAHQAAASAAKASATQRAAASARRMEQAQAHRRSVEMKSRERGKQHKPAKPLPVPPALPASR